MKPFLRAAATYLRDACERFGHRAYSQEGEDLILARYFHDQPAGFFVDVGAHHPYRFSNTHLLYRRGWRGVNIDAMPGSMTRFRRARPRDINLEVAIASEPGEATYYIFNEPALNTFDRSLLPERTMPPWKLVAEITLPVKPLRTVLEEVLKPGQPIDLLTVDVEGRDLDVLQSNDWVRFRPRLVLAETRGSRLGEFAQDPLVRFLGGLGYTMAARTFNTTFMMDESL
jgi:FkbM family methyltransferase